MNMLHFNCGDSANYLVYPKQRSPTSQYQMIRRRCWSWLGSMPDTCKILQQAAVAWSTNLLAQATEGGCDRGRHLVGRMGLRANYQKARTTSSGDPAESLL